MPTTATQGPRKSQPKPASPRLGPGKLLIDREIKEYMERFDMVRPFSPQLNSGGAISWGLSSMGYDIRVADEYKVFTNVWNTVVDPKAFDARSFVDFKGPVCIIPPNSFALARTVEYFKIPRNVLTICCGKCLTGDARVVDAQTGDYLPLKDFVSQKRSHTLSLDGWRLGSRLVAARMNNGLKPVYELVTRSGLRVKATATHPFRVLAGWKPLEQLQAGDRVAVARVCPVFGKNDWPEHEATLLGLMLADGQCHTPGHSPRYTTGDPQLVKAFTRAAQALGFQVTTAVRNLSYNLVNRPGHGGLMRKNRATLWLERLGCNVRSKEKHVPSIVFTARRERVGAFLRALFSGDGSAYSSGDVVCIEYSTISERLAYDVRHLLLRFGVFASVYRKNMRVSGEDYSCYRLVITDKEMIRCFAREIGFIPGSRKQRALEAVLEKISCSPRRKSNFDTLPPPAWATMREAVYAAGRSFADIGIRHTQPGQSLPYTIASRVAQAIQDEEFSALVGSDVVWDVVESILPAGEELVYDLTVPGVHNFVANDLVVHNSTYARCGIIVNVTPFEPEWEGFAVLEISNTTPLPAKIYSNEGIAQVLFFASEEPCQVSYADRKGKYQKQQSIVLPKI